MEQQRHFYKVDGKLVMQDSKLGLWERNPTTRKWQDGPNLSKIYEQSEPISQQEIITQYKTALELLDVVDNPQEGFIKETICDSKQMLFPGMTETRFIDDIKQFSEEEQTQIKKALNMAKQVHKGQTRDEGSPYISHCIAVARKAIQSGGDMEDVIVCLLHDAYEDFNGKREELFIQIKNGFGEKIASSIVKLSKWRGENKIDNTIYLNELSKDLVNLQRKGYDRINNLQSLRFSDEVKREKYLKETEEKYIPLFEQYHPNLAKQMKEIIELYKNHQLLLTEQEKRILNSFKKG